ncbi:PEP-CTERM sorting domain-containing protein [Roseateles sp. NT4]|uniref:PEP-CTERM sorting domain-containing protein n=1 Tax=Roseateles sp. NT4 TaxID=3453715 RepID=UPI003EED8A1E
MKKYSIAFAALCAAQACMAEPLHVDGLAGGWLSTTFSYGAAPGAGPGALSFQTDAPGRAVIGPVGGPFMWGKTVALSVDMQSTMASLGAVLQDGSFTQSFAAQGNLDIRMLDGMLGNLLSANIAGGTVQVDLATHHAVIEFNLTGLTSGSLYLTGLPASLRLEGDLAAAPVLGNCADYAYKPSCAAGEKFLDDFVLTSLSSNWSVSSAAFAAPVPEPATGALVLLGALVVAGAVRRSRTMPHLA